MRREPSIVAGRVADNLLWRPEAGKINGAGEQQKRRVFGATYRPMPCRTGTSADSTVNCEELKVSA